MEEHLIESFEKIKLKKHRLNIEWLKMFPIKNIIEGIYKRRSL
jgi:hypothetical protein